MKFQKSFFRHSSRETLAIECVRFFTKESVHGNPSKSLLIGYSFQAGTPTLGARQLTWIQETPPVKDLIQMLADLRRREDRFDFALVNLLDVFRAPIDVDRFVVSESSDFFSNLRDLLRPSAYFGAAVDTIASETHPDYPSPWAVALACRDRVRLRDEKIGLLERDRDLYYCLFFQAEEDKRPSKALISSSLYMARHPVKSPKWVIPRPPPRVPAELVHPAKFPETLVQEFIETFTDPGDWILDPMVGTASSLIAAARSKRNGVGVDLNPDFIRLARKRLAREFPNVLFEDAPRPKVIVLEGDARELQSLTEVVSRRFDYVITSPPYWSMLRNRGSEGQRSRRRRGLLQYYSDDVRDLGNVPDYETFLSALTKIYDGIATFLTDGGYFTVVVKNLKREHVVYPLAWDLVRSLCSPDGRFEYAGCTMWCQDDVKLKPFAVGTHWVSNVLHQYCLHFRKRN